MRLQNAWRRARRDRGPGCLAYYVLSILTGMIFFFIHGRPAFAADLMAAVFYLAARSLFYGWFAGTGSRGNDRQPTP